MMATKTTTSRKRAGARIRSGRRTSRQTAAGALSRELTEFARQTAAGRNWGHSGLSRVLRGVLLDEATWKPWPEAHSIWDEVNHIFYWSEDVLQTLEGRGASRPQAWPAGEGTLDDWRRAVGRVRRLHAGLVRRIGAAGPAELARTAPRSRLSHAQRILGGISHIAYHTGRIALLRRMYTHEHQPPPRDGAPRTKTGPMPSAGTPAEPGAAA